MFGPHRREHRGGQRRHRHSHAEAEDDDGRQDGGDVAGSGYDCDEHGRPDTGHDRADRHGPARPHLPGQRPHTAREQQHDHGKGEEGETGGERGPGEGALQLDGVGVVANPRTCGRPCHVSSTQPVVPRTRARGTSHFRATGTAWRGSSGVAVSSGTSGERRRPSCTPWRLWTASSAQSTAMRHRLPGIDSRW